MVSDIDSSSDIYVLYNIKYMFITWYLTISYRFTSGGVA